MNLLHDSLKRTDMILKARKYTMSHVEESQVVFPGRSMTLLFYMGELLPHLLIINKNRTVMPFELFQHERRHKQLFSFFLNYIYLAMEAHRVSEHLASFCPVRTLKSKQVLFMRFSSNRSGLEMLVEWKR